MFDEMSYRYEIAEVGFDDVNSVFEAVLCEHSSCFEGSPIEVGFVFLFFCNEVFRVLGGFFFFFHRVVLVFAVFFGIGPKIKIKNKLFFIVFEILLERNKFRINLHIIYHYY